MDSVSKMLTQTQGEKAEDQLLRDWLFETIQVNGNDISRIDVFRAGKIETLSDLTKGRLADLRRGKANLTSGEIDQITNLMSKISHGLPLL